MKNNYKILVLSDLKSTSKVTLKSTVSLAKMIQGNIEFFHVKKPIDVVLKENQLSAMRVINKKQNDIEKKIKHLIHPISKDFDIDINHSFTFGNVKNEIAKKIKAVNPDIIVLGKRKSKALNLLGDNITNFVFNNYKGAVMIASENDALQPNGKLSLGFLNNFEKSTDIPFADNLINHTEDTLKSFKIGKNDNVILADKKTVEYVFEEGHNSIKNLSNYLSKNNINLLCLDRNNNAASDGKNAPSSQIKKVIKKLDVSLLVANQLN